MPTGFTPFYRIERNGLDISDHFNDRLLEIRVDLQGGDGSGDVAVLSLDDRDWAIASPNVGERLKLYLGYVEVGMSYLGSFELTEVTYIYPPKSIQLKLASTGQRDLLKSQTTQNIENKSLGDIFKLLAGRAGLSAEISPDVAGRMVEYRNITGTPQGAIQDLERHYGLVAKVMDGRLIVTSRDEGQSVSGATVPIVVFTQEHFGSLQVKHTERSSYTTVKAAYVDPQDHITKFVEHAMPAIEGLRALPFVPGRKFNSKTEAEAAAKAQAQALQRARGEVDLQLAKGDPWLRDQQRVLIRGMREGINGSYVTEIVSHTYRKEQGILTAAKAKPDSDGDDYGKLFDEATPDFLRQNFLLPGAGGLIGSAFTLRGGQPTMGDFLAGVNPFQ